MKIFHALLLSLPLTLTACGTMDISAAHLRNTVPRYTTFTTETPQAIAECVTRRWINSGRQPLNSQQTDTGFGLQTQQRFDLQQKQPMIYIAIDTSREGSSVRFYSNQTDDMSDRSMVSIIQSCH